MRSASVALCALAVVVASVLGACRDSDTPETVEARLKDHFLFMEQPDDARETFSACNPGNSWNNPSCQFWYGTALSLDELLDYYRPMFQDRGWQRLIDNQQAGTRNVWTLSWRNDVHSMTINFQDPERYPREVDDDVRTIVNITVVERPQ